MIKKIVKCYRVFKIKNKLHSHFREGFCQLDKIAGNVDTACSPKALIFCVSWAESVRYFCMNIRGNSPAEKQIKK